MGPLIRRAGAAEGPTVASARDRWVAEVDGECVAALECGAEPSAVGFHDRLGGRYLRDRIGSWGRPTRGLGLDR